MAWNEPGGNNEDPWGKGKKTDGPPDLDVIFTQLKKKLFGAGNGNGNGSFGDKNKGFSGNSGNGSGFGASIGLVSLVLGGLYFVSGFYIVQPAEEAVITRFGAYNRTEVSGLHWYPRIFEAKTVVNVNEVKTESFKAAMLSKDENIVNVEIAVQYHVENSKDYLFNVKEPEQSLRQVSDGALRYAIGHSTLDEVLTVGRAVIASQIKEQIISNLAVYKSGLSIEDVAMQPASAPEEVKESFNDAIRAQEDEIRKVNEAEAYSRRTIPIAEGNAMRIFEEAQAYKQQVILEAKGEASRFSALIPEYKRAPKAMRERMYMATMQEVMTKVNKIVLDVNQGNNMFYLPLDKIIKSSSPANFSNGSVGSAVQVNNSSESAQMSNNVNNDSVRPRTRSEMIEKMNVGAQTNDNGGDTNE